VLRHWLDRGNYTVQAFKARGMSAWCFQTAGLLFHDMWFGAEDARVGVYS
jgi:hypothetical protein